MIRRCGEGGLGFEASGGRYDTSSFDIQGTLRRLERRVGPEDPVRRGGWKRKGVPCTEGKGIDRIKGVPHGPSV